MRGGEGHLQGVAELAKGACHGWCGGSSRRSRRCECRGPFSARGGVPVAVGERLDKEVQAHMRGASRSSGTAHAFRECAQAMRSHHSRDPRLRKPGLSLPK
jgi:hypothetical protein